MTDTPLSRAEFEAALRAKGAYYHIHHPYHVAMYEGRASREQIQGWVANRFYYQVNIPLKDAAILANCPDREIRREWIQRLLDHDGAPGEDGGIEAWLRLGQAVGLDPDQLRSQELVLPGVRFAVDAYVQFVDTRPWIEGVASSLTELFAPPLMTERLAAFETHYTWIDPAALDYFRSRPSLARRDSEHGLSLVLSYCRSREEQERAVAALRFKCELLSAQLDALYYNCIAAPDLNRC